MFMGPWDQGGPWNPKGIEGVFRFLRRVWTVATDPTGREAGDAEAGRLPAGQTASAAADELRRATHRTIKKVTEDHDDVPLEHDDLGADGADQPADAATWHGSGYPAGVG